jgi:hypothetical protein
MFSGDDVDSGDIRRLRDDIRSLEQKIDGIAQQSIVSNAQEAPAD